MQYGNYGNTFSYTATQYLFKSYYVVWKHIHPRRLFSQKQSLNRTMQYGNIKYKIKYIKYKNSLNRTMQYGNSEDEKTKLLSEGGLNRTMQYGNCQHIEDLQNLEQV